MFPNSPVLTVQEIHRLNRVRIAERLHKLPSEIDLMPLTDVHDLMEVWRADSEIEKMQERRKQHFGRSKR